MSKVYAKKEEVRYLVDNWDSRTISELAEDMSILFARPITRAKIFAMSYQLRKRGVKLSEKKKESVYDSVKKENVYDTVAREVKIKHL